MYMYIQTYKYECVCVYVCTYRHTHTELCSLETQKANFSLHSCVPHGLPHPLPHALQWGWELSACGSQIRGSGVSHCLTRRDKPRWSWMAGWRNHLILLCAPQSSEVWKSCLLQDHCWL